MDYREIKINWQKIDIPGIYFTNVDWRKLSVSESSQNIEWTHSRVVSPTYARVRTITIEWIVEKLDNNEFSASRINYLQKIFALQTNLVELEEKEFYVEDIFWNEWKILAKIKEPFDFDEWDLNLVWSHWKFRVVLESTKSPIFKSFKEKNFEGEKWDFWGFCLDFELDKAFDEKTWTVKINASFLETPLKIEILAISDVIWPISIFNLTNWKKFKIDTNMKLWDKIFIDSEKFCLTKNSENIIDKRLVWSSWFKVSGENEFLFLDVWWNFEKSFKVKIFFNDLML